MNYINGEEVAAKKEEQEEPLKLKKTDQAKGLIEKLNEFLQAEKKNYKCRLFCGNKKTAAANH